MFEQYLTKTGRLSCKQPQEIKNQWYIQRFQEVHGDKYDYSKVVYAGQHTKVAIICIEHDVFTQTPNNHLNGIGCPECQKKSRTKPTAQGIADFIKVHGNTYDYSQVVYTNNYTKVVIICKEHGEFLQTPSHHLKGKGCPKCQKHNQDTLYILKCLDTGLTKIGITNNLRQRLCNIGGNLEYLYHITVQSPRDLETELHKKYQEYNRFNHTVNNGGTEFFNLSESQIADLIRYLEGL